jgi:hypothetical protein
VKEAFAPASGRPRRRAFAAAVAVALVAASLVASGVIYYRSGIRPEANEYNIPAWELRNFPSKWLYAAGSLFRAKLSVAEEDARLQRFFDLTREIDALEQEASDASQRGAAPDEARLASLSEKRRERDRLENSVEAIIEGRLGQVISQQGLTRTPLHVVWPPVDFELTRSPYTLAVSPRDRIALIDSRLLREDLSLTEIENIEAATQRRQGVSALAFPTGGIGAYPTIVDYPQSYRQALEVVAHEWTHNYLAFRPLGFNYYDSYELRALNETVAELVGQELASAALQRRPLPAVDAQAPAQRRREGRSSETPVDVGAELRRLRGEVDALLWAGKIEEAEALMEQRRQELAARGVRIRKINQAYFAFVNLYAGERGSPGATNPIGPKVDELRRRAGSLAAFVRIAGGLTSVRELDEALAKLE